MAYIMIVEITKLRIKFINPVIYFIFQTIYKFILNAIENYQTKD